MHSQRMASIAHIVIGCIDYLAYRTIFTRVMFCPKIKLDVFFPARKAADVLMGMLLGTIVIVLVAWTEFCYKFGVR